MLIDNKNKRRILRGDGFDGCFQAFRKSPVYIKLLHKKEFSIGATPNVSYRVMNHWEKLGLISSNRKNGIGWRKFSLCDLVWHLMILSLREFGFPNEKILKVKDSLIDLKYPSGKPYPLFEYYLSIAIELRKPVFAIIYSDGYADIAEFEEIQFTQEAGRLKNSHIKIDVSSLLEKLFSSENLVPLYDLLAPLSSKELKIFETVRHGKCTSVNIELSNNGNDTERIAKIKTITHRKLKNGESLNKLVRNANQKTTIFSNNNEDLGIQIEKEIK